MDTIQSAFRAADEYDNASGFELKEVKGITLATNLGFRQTLVEKVFQVGKVRQTFENLGITFKMEPKDIKDETTLVRRRAAGLAVRQLKRIKAGLQRRPRPNICERKQIWSKLTR